ncbi:AAA family ATPase [Rhizobium sp. 10PS4]|uniref:AAA family ATPase n=1 Tax=Rhizobium sp. 10PS4 TaxID=3075621 RepID=UPI0028FD875C|nr:AAA family ATPase [Rhizobium sp. 10PS4]MDU0306730.1 AAA family ATPase [Rhizobium sp. 10PS4]
MLRFLRVRNFRAYRDHKFDFKRINIFIGANNSGKSTVLSAINLLAQTHTESRGRASPLVLNGPYEQLGTYQDVVHGNNVRTSLGFDIGFEKYEVSFDIKYRTQRREIEVSRFSLFENGDELYSFQSRSSKNDIKLQRVNIEEIFGQKALRRPEFIGFWPYQPEINRFAPGERLADEKSRKIVERVSRGLRNSEILLRNILRQFDTLSPFRDQPQRTYLHTGETPREIGRTGSSAITLLANDSSRRGAMRIGIEDQVSEWLRVNGIAKEIRVKSLTPRHFEICIVDFKGKEHNICDVGFGCSQVLPVLVGGLNLFLSPERSRRQPIFVVQEPEIHLHPNAQASLGSFFVGLSQSGGQQFIETHSDNLVLRIARHVAHGEVDIDDVKIFFVKDENGDKYVTDIKINSKGIFEPEWPGGFFPQRQFESLQLARARISGEKTSSDEQLRFKYLD